MDLIDRAFGVLNNYSGPGKEGRYKAWRELSSKLGSKFQACERGGALAFIVRCCLNMSKALLLDIPKDIKDSGRDRPIAQELKEANTGLQRVYEVLLLVFSADETGYGPVHCQCVKYYRDCLTALDAFTQFAASLLNADDEFFDTDYVRPSIAEAMTSAVTCVLRCWCFVRSGAGEAGALAADVVSNTGNLVKKLRSAADQSEVELWVLKFRRLMTVYICRQSHGVLQGMADSAGLTVYQPELFSFLEHCGNLANMHRRTVQGEDATRQLKYLTVFLGLLKKTYVKDPESLLKVVVSLEPHLRTVASAVFKSHGESLATMYSTLLDGDITQVWDRNTQSWNQTHDSAFGGNALGRQLFRVAPFAFAVFWLLSYLTDAEALREKEEQRPTVNLLVARQLQKRLEPGKDTVGQEGDASKGGAIPAEDPKADSRRMETARTALWSSERRKLEVCLQAEQVANTVRDGLSEDGRLQERLDRLNLERVPIIGDGNCQFRAVAFLLEGTEERHHVVRHKVVQHLRANDKDFSDYFLPHEWDIYVSTIGKTTVYGDEFTLKAISDLYGVSITSINGSAGPWYYRQPPKEKKLTTEIFLAFKDRDQHYEAIMPCRKPMPDLAFTPAIIAEATEKAIAEETALASIPEAPNVRQARQKGKLVELPGLYFRS